jgi:hypothetical protein
MQIETKFLRLCKPVALDDRINGWRVCWPAGWDRGKVFYVVMVERVGRSEKRNKRAGERCPIRNRQLAPFSAASFS